MPAVPVQVGPYRPVTFYDAPQVLFTQLLDGELGIGSTARTFLRPDQLTPSERDTLSERLAKAAGDNRMVRAMADVALNPFVWLMFLTKPVGASKTADLFKLEKGFSPYVVEKAPLGSMVGLLTSNNALMGTRTSEAIREAAARASEIVYLPEVQKASKLYGEAQERLGLKHGFNRTKYSPGTKEYEAARDIEMALWGAATGADRKYSRFEPTYTSKKALKKGIGSLREIAHEPWNLVPGSHEAVLRKYGVEHLAQETRNLFESVVRKGIVEQGPEGVLRMFRMLGRSGPAGDLKGQLGSSMVRTMLDDASASILKGNLTKDELVAAIQKNHIDPLTSGAPYFPRNVATTYVSGKEVEADRVKEAVWASALRTTASVSPRKVASPIYSPQDLEDYKAVFGSSPELDRLTKLSKKRWDKMMESGKPVRFLRISLEDGIDRYVRGMASTHGTFGPIGTGIREIDVGLDELRRDGLMKVRVPLSNHAHEPGLGQVEGAPLSMGLREAEANGLAPPGGFSVADVLYGDWATAANPWTRATIVKIVAPRLMGRIPDDRMFMESAMLAAKTSMGRFLESGVSKAIEDSSDFGRRWVAKAKEWADPSTAYADARGFEHGLVKAFYSSGLGLNVPASLINMTQPLTTLGGWVGYKHVFGAYGDTFADMGKYLELRASQGFRTLSSAERAEAIQKSFKHADVMEISGSMLETLEGDILKSSIGQHRKHGWTERLLFDAPMTMFRMAEMGNRSVAAYAVERRMGELASEGVQFSQDMLKRNQLQMIRETQFGGHWSNMPQMFLPESERMGLPFGRIASIPLVRQYMMFPTRSLGSFIYLTPRLGGRSPADWWKSYLNDTARLLAVSAIGVEAAKDLFNADVSRAGFVASMTDLVPGMQGGRFDGREGPIPIPPAVDTAFKFMEAGFTGDAELFKRTLPRILPMGSAVSRALKSAPDVGLLGLGQTQYADWGRMTEGHVPVYKDDGTLMYWEKPSTLILKGLGLSPGADEAKLMGYMVAQRDQVTEARRRYMQYMATGDPGAAEGVAQEFERRFKVPLTVTRGQMREFLARRETPRVDRQLGRINEGARPIYQQVVGESLGGAPDGVTLSPEEIKAMRAAVEKVPSQRDPREMTTQRWGVFDLPTSL